MLSLLTLKEPTTNLWKGPRGKGLWVASGRQSNLWLISSKRTGVPSNTTVRKWTASGNSELNFPQLNLQMRTQLAGTLISSLVSPWAKNTAKMHQIPKLWRQGDNKFVFFSAAKFEVICSIAIYYKFREFVLFPQLTRVIITALTFFLVRVHCLSQHRIVYHRIWADGFIFLKILKHVILCSKMDSGFSLLPESRVPLITSVMLEGELTFPGRG